MLPADMKLLIMRGHTGGLGTSFTGEAQLRLAQSLVSGKVKELLAESAVSPWPATRAHMQFTSICCNCKSSH